MTTCNACDCADPTAAEGLADDCDCVCHADPTALCICDHYADQHNDEQPHECLMFTLGGRARCSCTRYVENRIGR